MLDKCWPGLLTLFSLALKGPCLLESNSMTTLWGLNLRRQTSLSALCQPDLGKPTGSPVHARGSLINRISGDYPINVLQGAIRGQGEGEDANISLRNTEDIIKAIQCPVCPSYPSQSWNRELGMCHSESHNHMNVWREDQRFGRGYLVCIPSKTKHLNKELIEMQGGVLSNYN